MLSVHCILVVILIEWIAAVDYINSVTTSTNDPYNFILNLGDRIDSTARNTRLIMQSSDGNFVLYRNGEPLWAADTEEQGAEYVEISRDGNIFVKNTAGFELWTSSTSGHINTSPHSLMVDETCVYLMDKFNTVFWTQGFECSLSPTVSPTDMPTSNPSETPTESSSEPTEATTTFPTLNPQTISNDPTSAPSNNPTSEPSNNPTKHPSYPPTLKPTPNPSLIPSLSPMSTSSPVQASTVTEVHTKEDDVQNLATNKGDSFDWLIYVFIAVIAIVSFVSLVCLLYCIPKLRKQIKMNEMKAEEANDNKVVADMTFNAKLDTNDPNLPRVLSNSIDSSDDSVEQTEETKQVIQWLTHAVGLPQYVSIFVHHGFESMRIIQSVSAIHELMETGITNEEHLTMIMSEINKLKLRSMSMQSSMLSLYLQPQSMNSNAGIAPRTTYHEDVENDSDEKAVIEDIAMDKDAYTKGNNNDNEDEGTDENVDVDDDDDVDDVINDIVVKSQLSGARFSTKGE